jgi:hypothetical protein
MSAQKTVKPCRVPTIACVNKATIPLEVDFDELIKALQIYLDDCFVPVWSTPAKLVKAKDPLPDAWTLMFIDDPDAAKRAKWLGYHHPDKTGGRPFAKVFVNSVLGSKELVSVAASHELAEMLVDPAINLWTVGPKDTLYSYEVCDAVEEEKFSVNGILMSDFVYPAYFELFRERKSTQFDYMEKVDGPFQILKGGYAQVRIGSKITEKMGSKKKEKRFKKEDRTDHRSEYRKKLHSRKPPHTRNFKI